jgi:hypothetical protein
MRLFVALLLVASSLGIMATVVAEEELLVPSASRDPPPIHIPTPTHQGAASIYAPANPTPTHQGAASIYAPEKGAKQDEPFRAKYEKKSKRKFEETDDLYGLFPNAIIPGVGYTNDDDTIDTSQSDGPTTQFPFPIKIDIPLPPNYNHETTTHVPSARAVPPPSSYYPKKKGGKGSKSWSASSGKGSSYYEGDSDDDDKTRHPASDGVNLPKLADCYKHGKINLCDEEGGGEFEHEEDDYRDIGSHVFFLTHVC